jgi:hypothetical protein
LCHVETIQFLLRFCNAAMDIIAFQVCQISRKQSAVSLKVVAMGLDEACGYFRHHFKLSLMCAGF